jgi:5'-3' exonuclease
MTLDDDGALRKNFGTGIEYEDFALQLIVRGDKYEDPRFREMPPPPSEVEFPAGSHVFFLGSVAYGNLAEILSSEENEISVKLIVCLFFYMYLFTCTWT